MEAIIFDFSKDFDGLIGFETLQHLGLIIDPKNLTLSNTNCTIPLQIQRHKEPISIEANSVRILKFPVNILSGEIFIETQQSPSLYIPACVTRAENGLAQIEIYNTTSETQSVTPDQSLPATLLDEYFTQTLEIKTNEGTMLNHINQNSKDITTLLRTEHLNSEEKFQLFELCKKYETCFHFPNDALTFTNQVKHEIKTYNEIPIHTKTYRYPRVHQQEVKRQIDEMLQNNIIRPSKSPYSSPIWIVPKKIDATGKQKWRLVVDYRKINDNTKTDRYPLPNISDILDKLGRCQYFTTLDLASGFHQIEMHENSIEKTAFNTENGHYEYVRMPFGLKNAPATFQRVMDNVLKDLQHKICFVYMDDIIIFSTSLQEHIQNLELVFKTLAEANLKIQLDKSEFLCKQVEFLGHIITPEGIRPNPKKIESIKNFPLPKTTKEIKSFLGLLGFYRKFIPNFAKITKPLTQRLKKDAKIDFSQDYLDCFETCKNLLCNEPVLAYPDFHKTFTLTCDASNFAIGSILSQDGHPISYYSRTLNPAECNYSTIEKELLSIVNSVKYFRPYLFGTKFIIETDHQPLQWLFNLKDPNSRLVRWRLKLEEYDYVIKYKKGKINQADPLSRIKINPIETSSTQNDTSSMIAQVDDSDLSLDKLLEIPLEDILNDCNRETYESLLKDFEQLPESRPETDEQTIHTSRSNPILEIKYTDNVLNLFNHQYIISENESNKLNTHHSEKTFPGKTKHVIKLVNRQSDDEIFKFLRTFIKANSTKHALFFDSIELEQKIIRTLQNNLPSGYNFVICKKQVEDVLTEQEQQQKIKYNHEAKTYHRGVTATHQALLRKYYWPHMFEHIREYISKCQTCITMKTDRHPPNPKFQHTYTPSSPFELLNIDTLSINNQKIITIIDVFSKYAHAYPVDAITGVNVQRCLLKFIESHGYPYKILVDSGVEFNNIMIKDFCNLHKISLQFTSIQGHTTNGNIERFHSTLLDLVRCIKTEQPNAPIDYLISLAVIAYNHTIHTTTKESPINIIRGDSRPDAFDINEQIITSDYIEKHRNIMKSMYNQIKQNIETKKDKTISKLNESRREPDIFEADENVYIKNSNRNKLAPRYTKELTSKDLGPTVEIFKRSGHQGDKYHKAFIKRKPKPRKRKINNPPNNPPSVSGHGPPTEDPDSPDDNIPLSQLFKNRNR